MNLFTTTFKYIKLNSFALTFSESHERREGPEASLKACWHAIKP